MTTRKLSARAWAAVPPLVAALAGVGCAHEVDDSEAVPKGDPRAPTLYLKQRVLAFTLEGDAIGPPEPLGGVRVCHRQDDATGRPETWPNRGCTESAADGYFRLDRLAKYSRYVITAEHDGYLPVAEPYITTDESPEVTDTLLQKQLLMLPSGAEAIVGPPGLSPDPERGAIATFAVEGEAPWGPAAGVTIEVDGAETAYFGEGMRYAAGATGTIAADGAPAAAVVWTGAVIWNVEPGLRDVSFVHVARTCYLYSRAGGLCWGNKDSGLGCPGRNFHGYPTDRGNIIRVPVLPGYMTRYAAGYCHLNSRDF